MCECSNSSLIENKLVSTCVSFSMLALWLKPKLKEGCSCLSDEDRFVDIESFKKHLPEKGFLIIVAFAVVSSWKNFGDFIRLLSCTFALGLSYLSS